MFPCLKAKASRDYSQAIHSEGLKFLAIDAEIDVRDLGFDRI